jgi:Lon protease-like protein
VHALDAVPLFPLPNIVLFPRAVLPLHIFEERYKTMTADVLAGERQVAMALLRPGWEKNYYGRPGVEPVVCVGTIPPTAWERLPDGKYNFLLEGHTRAVIERELPDTNKPYRIARLRALEQVPVLEIDLGDVRQRLAQLFNEGAFAHTSIAKQFRQMLTSPLATPDVCDLIAFNVLDDVQVKQTLLAEVDVRARVERTVEALADVQRMLGPALRPDEVNLN